MSEEYVVGRFKLKADAEKAKRALSESKTKSSISATGSRFREAAIMFDLEKWFEVIIVGMEKMSSSAAILNGLNYEGDCEIMKW